MRNLTPPSIKKSPLSISRRKLYLAVAAASQLLCVGPVYAGPQGGQVVGGAGSIDQSDLHTTINQHTDRMAIDWQSFNVASDERVQFVQPSASSVALNRVLSHKGSEIHGRIEANGHVILVNPNGVFFGEGSQINVGGIIASGLQISPNDFMNGDFTLTSVEGAAGKVINSGIINAATGGSVTLVGQQVKNDGLISAKLGAVSLMAGKEAVVTFDERGLVGIKVTNEILQDELGIDAAIINNGEINAEGGRILISASASQDIFSEAVNHGGLNQAKSVVVHDDGSFTLGGGADVVNTGNLKVSSDSGDAGQIVVLAENLTSSGEISADSISGNAGYIELHARDTALLTENSITSAIGEGNAVGGQVKLLGHHVGLFDQSSVDVSGALGGGEVLIGGDFQGKNSSVRNAQRTFVAEDASIYADALEAGDGGKVIVWADDITRYYGSIYSRSNRANGGFAEVSGKNYLDFDGRADLKGLNSWGNLLLDPRNITIAFNSGQENLTDTKFDDNVDSDLTIRSRAITRALESANVTLEATDNITVDGAISTAGNRNSLTLVVGGSIDVNAEIDLGSGDLIFSAGVSSCGEVVDCTGSGPKNFTLNDEGGLSTNGSIFINAADNVFLEGKIGESRAPESVVVKAGNDITLTLDSFIIAGLNPDTTSHTIHLSAGDSSLASSGNFAESTVEQLTGNLEISGRLTTEGGSIYLTANGGVDTSTTGVVTIKENMVTKGGDFIVRNTGDFSNNFIESVTAIHENDLRDLVNIINTSSEDRSGGGDISIISGGNVTLGTVKFGYNSEGNGSLQRVGSLTVGAGKDFTLAQILNFNNTANRDPSNNGAPYSPGVTDNPFVKVAAGGNITIKEGAKILDYYYGDARDSLNVDLHAASRFDESGGVEHIPGGTGVVDINADIYTAGGNFTASGYSFHSDGIAIDTDKANDSSKTSTNSGDESNIASVSLGGNVSISAISAIELGSVITDSNCSATPSACKGDLTISRIDDPSFTAAMQTNQASGGLAIHGRTTINVGSNDTVNFTTDSNKFTGGFVLQNAGSVSITDAAGDIMLNGVNVKGLDLVALNGSILQVNGSAITVTGGTTLNAGGTNSSIVLNELVSIDGASVSRNNFGGMVSATTTGGVITLGDVDDFILGEISSSGGNITLNTGLRLTQGRTVAATQGGGGPRGNVVIAGPINSANASTLTINANDIELGGSIGATGPLGSLIFNATGDINAASNSIYASSLTAEGFRDFNAGAINTSRSNAKGGDITISGSGDVDVGALNTQGMGASGLNGYGGGDIILRGNTIRVAGINTSGADAVTIPAVDPILDDPNTPDVNESTPGTPAQTGLRGLGGAVTITSTGGGNPAITLDGDITTLHGDGLTQGSPVGDARTQGAVTINLSQPASVLLNYDDFFTSNITLNGTNGGNGSSLRGFNHGGTWTTTSTNSGEITGTAGSGIVTFNNFANLQGGDGDDIFVLRHNIERQVYGGDGNDHFTIGTSINGDIRGQNGDDYFLVSSSEAISARIYGGAGNDTIQGGNRVNNWNLTNDVSQVNENLRFSDIEHIVGGKGQDIFRGNIGAFINVGSISGGVDNVEDVLDTVVVEDNIELDFVAGVGGFFKGVTNAEIISSQREGGGTITVKSPSTATTEWDIESVDGDENINNEGKIRYTDGEFSDGITFTNFSTLIGGEGKNIFKFFGNSTITGSIDGGDGVNVVDIEGAGRAHHIRFGGRNDETTIHVSNIQRVIGNSNDNTTLSLASGTNTWNITDFDEAGTDADGQNDGVIVREDSSRIEFVNFQNLIGGSGNDEFVFSTLNPGSFTGRIDGGGGSGNSIRGRDENSTWTINSSNGISIIQSGAVDPYLASASNIQILQGGSGVDIFNIDADYVNTIRGGDGDDTFNVRANGRVTILDGEGGIDTLVGRNSDNQWDINSRRLSVDNGPAYVTEFVGMEVLQGGSAADEFIINAVFAGTLNGGAGDDLFRVVNDGRATQIIGGTETAQDTLDITAATNNLHVAVDEAAEADLRVTGVERLIANSSGNHTLIGRVGANNAWAIENENSGVLNSVIQFEGFANLVGGDLVDNFIFTNPNANITGIINGGQGTDSVNLTARGDSRVQVLGEGDTAVAGSINVLSIESVTAAGDSQLVASNGKNTWRIDGENSGTLASTESGSVVFAGFNNLLGGTDDDSFQFVGSGHITGIVDGGDHTGDSVDVSEATNSNVRLADVSNPGSGFVNIEKYIGNGLTSTLYGSDTGHIWTLLAGTNAVAIGDAQEITFTGFANLQGGSGVDTFNINEGTLTGWIKGGEGNDIFAAGGGTVEGGVFGEAGDDAMTAVIQAGAVGSIKFFGGEGANDRLIITGGGANYTALHDTIDDDRRLVYTDQAGNAYTVSFETVNRVQDNLTASLLTVNGTSDADTFVLRNNQYNLAGQDIEFTNKRDLTIAAGSNDHISIEGQINVGGELTLRNASVTASGTGLISAATLRLDGTAQVGSAENRVRTDVNNLAVTSASGAIYLREQNALNLTELSSNNIVDLILAGNLTSSTPLIFTRDLFVNTTGGDILLNGENQLTGNLSFVTNGSVNLRNTSATHLGNIQAQNLTVNSTGSIDGAGVLAINGRAEFTSPGNITLTNADNDFNSVVIKNALNTSIQDRNQLSLAGADTTGSVNLSAQNISVNGLVKAGALTLTANEEVMLGSSVTTTNNLVVTTQGVVNQRSDLKSTAGNITINAGQFVMSGGTQLSAEAGDINVTAGSDANLRNILARGDIHVDAGGSLQINDLIRSIAGDINLAGSGNVNLANNLQADKDITLQSRRGAIQQQAQINTQTGNITLTAAGDISMNSDTTATAATGNISYTGSSIAASSFVAEAGTVTLAATQGAITDNNGDSVNVTANRLVADAMTGIGSAGRFETMISELSLSNNTGLVDLQNSKALTINRLHSNGDVVLNNLAGDITLNNTSGALYDRVQTDARLAGGTVNANYEIGSLTINVANGNLLASNNPGPNVANPDIVARTAVLTTPVGSIGSPERMLVIYVKDHLLIGGARSWGPLWGFDTRPVTVDNQATIQGSLSDLLASGNEQLVEVETLDEVNPAVFTSVRNYFYDDIAILLPRDQLYYDDEE